MQRNCRKLRLRREARGGEMSLNEWSERKSERESERERATARIRDIQRRPGRCCSPIVYSWGITGTRANYNLYHGEHRVAQRHVGDDEKTKGERRVYVYTPREREATRKGGGLVKDRAENHLGLWALKRQLRRGAHELLQSENAVPNSPLTLMTRILGGRSRSKLGFTWEQ